MDVECAAPDSRRFRFCSRFQKWTADTAVTPGGGGRIGYEAPNGLYAAAALGAAAKAGINLPWRHSVRAADFSENSPDVVIAEDVAGTNDHLA